MTLSRRTYVEILASIIKHTKTEPLNISRIIQVENLSHNEARKYLKSLLSANLIRAVETARSVVYQPTERGLDFESCITRAFKLLGGH